MRRGTALRICAVGALLLGLGLGVAAYLAPGQEAPPAQGYSLEGGQTFETSPWDTRAYRRGLEYIGGKQALFFAELRESAAGFAAGLLGGAPLALCLGGLGAVLAWRLLRAADRADGDGRGEG